MATITGQKLSNLSSLILGTTGTLFYVESPSLNSYKMNAGGVYNTLNKFYISGNYQPKNEDWRFVHKTGTESITGFKHFVSDIKSSIIYSNVDGGSQAVIEVNNNKLRYFDGFSYYDSVVWNSGILYNFSDETISLDWQNRMLSGDWNGQNLKLTSGVGFWGSGVPQGRPVVTGSRGANVALESLLTGLHYMGIINNQTII